MKEEHDDLRYSQIGYNYVTIYGPPLVLVEAGLCVVAVPTFLGTFGPFHLLISVICFLCSIICLKLQHLFKVKADPSGITIVRGYNNAAISLHGVKEFIPWGDVERLVYEKVHSDISTASIEDVRGRVIVIVRPNYGRPMERNRFVSFARHYVEVQESGTSGA